MNLAFLRCLEAFVFFTMVPMIQLVTLVFGGLLLRKLELIMLGTGVF